MAKRVGMPRTFPGRVRISRIFGSSPDIKDREFRIEIGDGETGACVTASLSGRDFAAAVTGQEVSGVDVEWRALEALGLKYEHKRVAVHHDGFSVKDGMEKAVLAPYEVDGWTGYVDDLKNGHRHGRDEQGEYHMVLFTRYVDPDTGKGVTF